jgi:hypothetical protein
VVVEPGLTDWLPLVFFDPLQAPEAAQAIGGVAFALRLQ